MANLISGLAINEAANLDNPYYNITPQLWTYYWKSAKERTSSASERLHFGAFEAGVHHPVIVEFEARMTNETMQSGYSPKQWQMVTDAMLIKKEGITMVETVRMTIRFMADCNYMNNHIGRAMMSNSERYGQLATEQFGSRNGHTAIMQDCNKKFTLDIKRQKCITMSLCSTDLTSCYDRVVHSVASIAMQQ
jgi:UDP-galactopyranose mutase